MKIRPYNKEVLFADEDVVPVSARDMEWLKNQSLNNARKRIRLCAHGSTTDPLHEMLMVHQQDCYVRPHKHQGKSESLHVMEGAAEMVLFHDDGAIMDVLSLGTYDSGKIFYNRLSRPVYHTLLITSDCMVFHETTNGPFDPSHTLFAPWSPEETDFQGVLAFLDRLKGTIHG